MDNEQTVFFLTFGITAIALIALFGLHSLAHYCAWVASEWLRRRNAPTERVRSLRPMGKVSEGWAPNLDRLPIDKFKNKRQG